MTERALAHVEKIEWIRPIEGADNIELIGVLGWVCIAKKGEFNVGDMAVYIEIDSKCPETDERFAFLANKKFKVKTMKLGKFKVISQGLALPLSLFPELQDKNIGDNVTEALKITYASEEDAARKTNKVDPNAKYKSMAKRRPKLFANPIVRRIMRYSIGRKIMFLLFGRKIIQRSSQIGLSKQMRRELRMHHFIFRVPKSGLRLRNAMAHLQLID